MDLDLTIGGFGFKDFKSTNPPPPKYQLSVSGTPLAQNEGDTNCPIIDISGYLIKDLQ